MMKKVFCITALTGLLSWAAFGQANTAKPWTYWWWMGSAVNKEDIRKQLATFSEAGLGGVHIIPIYGAKGYEDQFLPFLSEHWMEMVQFTIEEAGTYGLGVDMTLGTGWPYGGPWITPDLAAKKLVVKELSFAGSERIHFRADTVLAGRGYSRLLAVLAMRAQDTVDLTPFVQGNVVDRSLAGDDWQVVVFGVVPTNQRVKRAAPGGEGLVMDYFDAESVRDYLDHFDSALTNTGHPVQPRAFYHDSYEVYGANWTPDFLHAFNTRQGYDLSGHWQVLADRSHPEYGGLVHDIRETLAQLLYDTFTVHWTTWCTDRDALSRNQAHGSPGNLLDLYGQSDIPETESFGCSQFDIPGLRCDPDYPVSNFGRPHPLMMKFASSPAHVLGKPLVSSETATWLANHFKVSLQMVKPQVDELFTAGINHIFYHGTTYSPEAEPYPGWLFYASTNFGERAHFRDEFPLLNNYIENCQTLLQASDPDHDILLYFPIHDLWSDPEEDLLMQFTVHHYDSWFQGTPCSNTAEWLWDSGYTFDYISDRQLDQLAVGEDNSVYAAEDARYRVIVVPAVQYMPESTLERLHTLAEQGARIIFMEHLPRQFPGYLQESSKQDRMREIHSALRSQSQVRIAADLAHDLERLQIRRETLKGQGLDFTRKRNADGNLYFITNLDDAFFEDIISLASEYTFVEIYDPQTGRKGYIETTGTFPLRLPPGKSCFVQTLAGRPEGRTWINTAPIDTLALAGAWKVYFEQGNSENLQPQYTVDSLHSWTAWGDAALQTFSGKGRYVSQFTLEGSRLQQRKYRLVFEDVRESAAVYINGTYCGTVWAYPLELEIPAGVLKKTNRIEIVVQNLSANHMIQYDAAHPEWKKFYDINMVDIRYKPFSASDWAPEPSGLIGNVRLIREGPL
jgi:hypothetical protein